ncbi:MAG: zinc ribbon domain-containing protein [Rhodanobacteraceae bacterium]
MPIYEFECASCAHRFDRLQKLSDVDPVACPECGRKTLHRVLNAPAFRLAGSGWYETDFKKEGDKKRNLAAKDEAPKSEDGSKTETRQDATKQDARPESAEKSTAAPSTAAGKSGTNEGGATNSKTARTKPSSPSA